MSNRILIGKEYTKNILELIENTVHSIDILMFDWRWYKNDVSCDMSSVNLAIIRAIRRGVKVRAYTNFTNIVDELKKHGVDAKVWNNKKLMHAKCVIFDRKLVLTGSHNFTQNGLTSNIEVSHIIDEQEEVKKLVDYFDNIF